MSPAPVLRRLRSESEFRAGLERDVRAGLDARPKELPPKYFYDARGSELFEAITRLPEYYLTRAETSILERYAAEIVERAGADEMLEIGGGYSHKTELLLRPFERRGGRRYASLDVSEEALASAARRLGPAFPGVEFAGIVGDFELDLAQVPVGERTLVVFLGSTIGNLEGEARARFLAAVRARLGDGGAFLLGVDLVKDKERLDAAYDDARGITAEFNLNVLAVLNRELAGDLPLDAFRHRAAYDPARERIEMWLVAREPVHARLAAIGLEVDFDAGEAVRTEISCKFQRAKIERELAAAGLRLEHWIPDRAADFALALARPGSAPTREDAR